MILLDRRIGSSDLFQPLRALNLPVELTTLESADVAWLGRGLGEEPVPVGVEIKRIGDLLTSITTGRLSGYQLPKLIHEYRHAWLLIEGQYRSGAEGLLETRQGAVWAPHALGRSPWTYREVEAFLTTLEVRAGVHVRRTYNRIETVALVAMLYQWWTKKAYDDHRAHQAMYSPTMDAGLLYKPSLARRVAAELPGVGVGKSGAVADHFKTVRKMVEADKKEWIEVPGIGKTLAQKITAAINGESR
jgi:ERCC4-type nuclease